MARLRDIAEEQWGLLTVQQAAAAEVGWRAIARLVGAGHLERVTHGVYRVRGAPETDHLELRAAWLRLDPARPAWQRLSDPGVAVVSHASAAGLYGIDDLRADVHEFTLPVRRQTRRPDVRIHRALVPRGQRAIHGGLPVVSGGWMVGQLLADHVEPDAVGQIARDVLDGAIDSPDAVAAALAPYAHHHGHSSGDGAALLSDLLERAGMRGQADASVARTP